MPENEFAVLSDAPPGADERKEAKRFSENHYNRSQTLAAWLLATFVAVNTSGAAAILNAGEGSERQPALMFALGVIFALLSGMASFVEAYTHEGVHCIRSVAQPTAEQTANLGKWEKWAPRLWWAALVLNGFSLLAFIGGCLWSAWAF